MAATRGVARETLVEQVGLLRRTEIAASQPDVLEGYTSDLELAKVVKRLLTYLQPVVTLMATLVPPTEESILREKMVREALNQADNMVLTVSTLFCSYHHFNNVSFLFSERYGNGLGTLGL